MRQNRTLTLTVMHGVLNGPPRVGKSTLISKLFLRPNILSNIATSPQLSAITSPETSSTGIADRAVQISVRRSSTVLSTAPKAGMKWELQSLDDEAIGLLKAIMTTVSEGKPTAAQKFAGLLATFKQHLTWKPKIAHTTAQLMAGQDHPKQRTSASPDENKSHTGRKESAESNAGINAPTDVFRDAFWNSRDVHVIQSLLEGSFTFYLTDTGGQPEFQELLAALIAGPTVFFLVFKLPDGLNQKYTVQYVRRGSDKSKPYVSSFTVKEMLLQSLASIACTSSYADH